MITSVWASGRRFNELFALSLNLPTAKVMPSRSENNLFCGCPQNLLPVATTCRAFCDCLKTRYRVELYVVVRTTMCFALAVVYHQRREIAWACRQIIIWQSSN